ncbi:hypothetical protein Hanom_Chr16g01427481 [Helianthus anomalus]
MVVETETTDVGATKTNSPEVVARELKKGKSIQEDPVITTHFFAATSALVIVEKSPEETLGDYYYRCYSEKRASDINAPVWKLKHGDTFSDWQICRDWLLGVFPPAEVKFQEERSHDQTYHAYLEETASSTSTTHRIKEANEEKAKVALLRAKLKADQARFESEQKSEECSVARWKRKAEAKAALLSEERKHWREICEKDNNEKMGLRNNINNLKVEIEKLKKEKIKAEAARDEARSHRERSEQREVQNCTTLALKNKEIDKLTSLLSDQEQMKAELESAKKICSLRG